ncbi:MAG: UbiA family prenyltransferase [Steroidobacteraceae bacterium]
MAAQYRSVNGGAARLARAPADDALPLVVDLEGALLKVNALHESLIALLVRRPWQLVRALLILIARGRAHMEAMIASLHIVDVETLPLREEFLMWLRRQAAEGRELHLVSAADQGMVERLAARLRLFDSCVGNDGHLNLKGAAKADYLTRRFPEGFSYAGGSAAELAVWRSASAAIVAGAQCAVRRCIESLNKPIEAEFLVPKVGTAVFLKQLRLHQWSKNLLVFLPLLLAHRFTDLQGWLHALLAFSGMSLVASGTYMVNDLTDLSDDRRHITKRNRPLAAGVFPGLAAVAIAPLMLIVGFVLAFAATPQAALVLAVYLAITLAYTFRLKRVPLLDTAVIGSLFTLRIVLGAVAVRAPPSPWLLAFSVMLFFSLAMAKRHSEIAKASRSTALARIAGRGYEPGDVLLTLVYGIASGVASLVISMLYITNGVATVLYGSPDWLWAVPLLLYLWQMRVWLLAHRGMLDDDPIVFALKDKTSLALGVGCLLALYLAL